jgi:hypothetical protein
MVYFSLRRDFRDELFYWIEEFFEWMIIDSGRPDFERDLG